ncbi:hypothetical protein RCL1_004209 [Eukaryota sp. TZLM3-RCL]
MTTIENKKNELSELKSLLDNPHVEQDAGKRTEVLKRVIEAMTLGIDVSPLFTKMIMLASTKDQVQKKLIYLFLSNYAETSPDLTMLTVNTLLKDCTDSDPVTRGLALRQLCNLRVPTISEYVLEPIKNGLSDSSSYVRKTAVMGCLRLFKISKDLFEDSGLLQTLFERLNDSDPQTKINIIMVLSKIFQNKQDSVLNLPRSIIIQLLNEIDRLPDFLQSIVLHLVSFIEPVDEEELFSIMNIIDSRLDHYENGSVVLSAAEVMIKITQNHVHLIPDVINRVAEPLFLLVNDVEKPELSLIALSHIKLLLELSCMNLPSNDVLKYLLIRSFDSVAVSKVKVELIAKAALRLGNNESIQWVLEQLSSYMYLQSQEVAVAAIQSMTLIGVENAGFAEKCIQYFCEILSDAIAIPTSTPRPLKRVFYFASVALRQLSAAHLLSDSNCSNIDVENCRSVLSSLVSRLLTFQDGLLFSATNQKESSFNSEAFVALIWILSAFISESDEIPFILENYVSAQVFNYLPLSSQLELINAVTRSFIQYPTRTAPIIKTLFSLGSSSMYVETRQRVSFLVSVAVTQDLESLKLLVFDEQEKFRLMKELDVELSSDRLQLFNSMKVVDGFDQNPVATLSSTVDDDVSKVKIKLLDPQSFSSWLNSFASSNVSPFSSPIKNESTVLDSDELDLLNFSTPSVVLTSPNITPQDFQRNWGTFTTLSLPKIQVSNPSVTASDRSISDYLNVIFEGSAKVIASGRLDASTVKLFFALGVVEPSAVILFELVATPSSCSVTAKYPPSLSESVVEVIVSRIVL